MNLLSRDKKDSSSSKERKKKKKKKSLYKPSNLILPNQNHSELTEKIVISEVKQPNNTEKQCQPENTKDDRNHLQSEIAAQDNKNSPTPTTTTTATTTSTTAFTETNTTTTATATNTNTGATANIFGHSSLTYSPFSTSLDQDQTSFSNYDIIKKHIGNGCQGYAVNLIRDKQTMEYYIQKLVQASDGFPEVQNLKMIANRMKHEQCENIIELEDFEPCYNDSFYCLYLEYIDGVSLDEFIQCLQDQATLENRDQYEKLLVAIIYQILIGLQFLKNETKIIHRDIKPSNIMIRKDGTVKIIDFGLSIHETRLNDNLTCRGTSAYMCPTKLRDGIDGYHCDIYSLGMILLEMISGELPFASDDNFFVGDVYEFDFEDYVEDSLPHLDQFSDSMVDFIRQSLSKNIDERATVETLLAHDWIQNGLSQLTHSKCLIADLVDQIHPED